MLASAGADQQYLHRKNSVGLRAHADVA
jgi:hypothetical protein